MTKLGLLERIIKLCSVVPLRIEIWKEQDHEAECMKYYVNHVKRVLEQEHPNIEFLRTKKTDCLWNFNHPFFMFLPYRRKGYVLKITPNIDPYELKKTCMRLEYDSEDERIADIGVYLSNQDKISGKDL